MLLQIALIALATLVALNLGWLLAFQSPFFRRTARPASPIPPATLPPPAAAEGSIETADGTAAAALEVAPAIEVQVVGPAERSSRWRSTLQARGAWLRAHSEETAAGLVLGAVLLYVAVFFPRPAGVTHPGEFGHPFQGLHWVRDFLLARQAALALALALVTAVCCLGLLGLAVARRHVAAQQNRAASAGLLMAALGLAGVGQMALLGYYEGAANVLYGAALALFVVWAITYRPYVAADLIESSWPRWLEIALLALTIGLTIFMRFYSLRTIPYGIEGDESKWTVEVIDTMVDGVFTNDGEFHIATMPLSFFMQAPFHWLLGPSILSARIAVASWSVLGSLIFYLLARFLTSPPVAWLATTLLATSLLDVSASRYANVESHVKLAPLLALALLALATRRGKPVTYALAGAAVAIGLLTYDTVLPLALVCGLVLLIELFRAKAGWAESVRRISAFAAPILLIMPMLVAYFSGRLGYYVGYASGTQQTEFGRLGDLALNAGEVLNVLFVQSIGDFIYSREGPLFNSLLLPWLTLGATLALISWRQGRMLWILLWGGVFFFVAPVLTHTPVGRVFYPGLSAAELLIAIGLYAAYRDLGRALGPALLPALRSLALVGLGLLALSNLYIYFNLMNDPLDRL
ncbi:MAG TPA: glycosyltransferase family 39 protein, partial [Roseiflexaceae bacterium]